MAKLIVIYEPPKDVEGFEQYYHNVHIPLVQKLPNLKGAEVHHVLQTQNHDKDLYLFAELYFETLEELNQSLASAEGREVQKDVVNLMPFLTKPPIVSVVD